MSVSKETYLIYGFKFGEEFTKEFWEEDFREETEYFDEKDSGKIKFLSDGMNGNYTFFGQIIELGTRGNWYEDEIKEVELNTFRSQSIIYTEFMKLYPESEVRIDDIKLYYVPHYV